MLTSCSYCRDGAAETKDHVPPRSFFPELLPDSTLLVTAPCCQLCHDRSKGTDGVLRNLFISLRDTECHPHVQSGLAAKRDRSLARGEHDLRHSLALMCEVDVFSPTGIFLRRDWAFDLNNPLLDQFAERLIRALLAYEFQQPFFDATVEWRLNPSLPSDVYAGFASFGRVRIVHEVFAYGVTCLSTEGPALAVANFYGSMEMFIRAQRA